MPNRVNPIAKYLFALSAMIVAWTVYAKVAVPYLEGPPTVVRRQQVSEYYPDVGDILDKSHLSSIIPADAWELGSCKTLLTPQGTIYFEEMEPLDDQGTYQLMPFTIVVNDPVNKIRTEPEVEPEKKTAPIVLRSLEGARLKFTKPLTARSKNDDVELESAQLDGQVTVFRPANPGTEEDQLRIVTRNIQINRSHIFTLADVYFSFGPHHGSGRNLSIQLTHKPEPDSPAKSFSNINGVEQMELAFVSELVLQPVDAHAFNPDRLNQKSSTPMGENLSLSNQKTPLRLSCEGPFVFRMAEKKAWFRDNVVVTQLDDFRDNLHCDSLQIELEKSGSSEATSVRNLIAIGSPEKPATIVSNSQQTVIVGEELNFDVERSIVKAAGSEPVSVRSPKFAFLAPTFAYQLAQDGRLGLLVAEGPGALKGTSDDQKTFEVRWEQELNTENVDAERIQINVDTDAYVKFDQESRITADQIRFVLWQLPDPLSAEGQTKWKYFPSKLDTRGNVRIINQKLDGTTKEMIANWEKPTARELGTIEHTVSFRPAPQPQLPQIYDDPKPQPRPRGDFRALPTQKPAIKFSGDKVIANVTGSMNRMEVRDLTVDGSLVLESNAEDRRPFAITGHSMKLVPQASELYRVTIDGNQDRLATFKSEGFDLSGNNLQLDQSANTIWVQGKGKLNIVPPRGAKLAAGKAAGPDITDADVAWNGGMVFDGSKIYFENEVSLNANRPPNEEGHRSTLRTNSEALTIELTESIRFEKVGAETRGIANRDTPEIQRMVFVNNVGQNNRAFKLASTENKPRIIAFQNATFDANGEVLDLQKLFVPSATVDAQTGDIVTSGPGQALVYQYSSGQNRLSGFTKPNPSGGTSEQKLTCIHSRFDGQLTASANKGTMKIERNTRSAWGNVNRLDQTLDPDRPGQLPLGAAVLKSDVLRFAQWTPRNGEPRQEMQAEGNTSIKSELFETVADRLTYNDATDMLVIEGKPPANAKLSYRRTAKSRPETVMAQKVKYRLSDQWTEVSDIRSVEASLSRGK